MVPFTCVNPWVHPLFFTMVHGVCEPYQDGVDLILIRRPVLFFTGQCEKNPDDILW